MLETADGGGNGILIPSAHPPQYAHMSLSQWSKATYTYGVAVCLLQLGGDEERAEAVKLMGEVPKLRQRIAGKSIPLEVSFLRLHLMHQ